MTRMPLISAILIVASVLPANAQEKPPPVLLVGFESLDGLSLTYDRNNPASKASLNTDAAFVSEGAASLLLESVSPTDATGNTYVGVMVPLAEPISLKKRAIVFDAWTSHEDNTRALYVRGYDAGGKCALSWLSWNSPVRSTQKTEIQLIPGLSTSGLSWEPGRVQVPNRDNIVRLEFIIGTHEAGAPYDIVLDNVRLVASEVTPFMETEKAKPLYRDTRLVEGGQARAIILCPDDASWREVAQQLQSGLDDRLGVRLPIRTAGEATDQDLRSTQVIALGCVANNPRLLYLYAHSYTYADDLYPGPDGYVVQSIHDPWGTGKNVLLIGASTVEGARLGLPLLLEAVSDDGAVGPLFRVRLAGIAKERWHKTLDQEPNDAYMSQQQQAAERALERGAHTGLFNQIATVGSLYAQTRKDGYARLFAWLVRRAKQHHDSNPGTYGGPWGMDSDFRIYSVLPMWDQVEESPALTDEDRLEITQILFQWVSDVGAPKARSVVGNERVRFNHQTFPALGLLFAGEYFDKYYHAVEAKSWLDIADAAFKMQAKAFKAYEDCNGYQWLTLYHTMLYALARPDFTFFDNGNVRRCADFAILCMDNLGYQVTYGDTGAFTGWWSEMPFLRGALWRHRDGRYAWALNKKFEVSGRVALGQYVADVAGREPDDLIGAIAWSLDPYYYRTFGGPDAVPEDHAVDKVVFRNGFDPEDQYLLLDGLSNGGHKHLDGNSISRWTENGRIWLADADYILSLPKYHNGVLIFRDGQSQPIPGFVELEHIVDLPSFGASTTTYRNYAGVDWRRHILWLKGDCFLVADEMLARQDGDYSFRVVWNTIGEVTLTDNGLSILQDGQYASIAVTPECRLSLQDDAQYGKNWSGYKHIREPVVRVFKAIRDCRLNAGESVVLFSLLHASGPKPSGPRLVRVAENVVGVLGLDEPMLAGVGDDAGEFSIANDVSVSAAAGILTPSKAFVVGATRIQAFGQTVTFPDGADAEADISGGTALVIDPARTTVNAHAASIEWQTMPASPDAIRALIERAMASAPAVVRPTAAAVKIPRPLKRLWSYREKLDAYLLTANAGAFEAVDAGLRLSCSPEPLPANVFSGEPGRNTLDNILDGKVQGTENCVMWDDDQPVTIRLDFDNEYRVSRLVLKAWFATSSSKNKLFQLADLTVEASNDGFAGDVRTVIQFTDEEMHGNWGAPGHAPHTYEFADLDAKARSLRVRLRPRKGTAIYVAELEVWGDRPGLADQAAGAKRKRAPVHTFSAVTMADLDGDGVDEVIAGSTNGKVYALAADGRMLWDFDTGGAVNAVSCVDFDGDGKQAVVAGSMGATVTALSARGQRLWTFAVPYYKRTGHVRVVFAADLAGDGKQAAIVGADNWHFYALDVNGEEIWRYESVHGSTCGAAADVDADGKDEVIAGTEYYWWHVVRPDGKRLFSYSTRGGPHANAVTAAKLTDNGRGCAVFGGADGNVHAIGPDGKLLWLLNTGDEVTSVCSMDVDGDGLDEILAASMSFNVYAINASGKVVWRRDLSSEVSCLAAIPARGRPAVLAGTRDGGVYLLDAADGRVLAGTPGSSPILAIAPGRSDGGAPVAAVAAANGDLALLSAD